MKYQSMKARYMGIVPRFTAGPLGRACLDAGLNHITRSGAFQIAVLPESKRITGTDLEGNPVLHCEARYWLIAFGPFPCTPQGGGHLMNLPLYLKEDGKCPGSWASWEWDGDKEKPTLTPSILRNGVWHGYLRKGYWVACE